MTDDAAELLQLEKMLDTWKRELHLERELEDIDDLETLQMAASAAGAEADDQSDWITLADAAEAAGVSRSSLRAWYRAGDIPSRLEPGPHGLQRMVRLDAVLARARRTAPSRPRRPILQEVDVAEPERSAPDALVKLVETVCAQAAEREQRAEQRAADAEVALRAALERAAAAEAEVRMLRAQLRQPD